MKKALSLDLEDTPIPLETSRLCTIVSSSALLDASIYQMAVETVSRGGKVAYVDCGNTFNPYVIVKLCKSKGMPHEQVLEGIYISRPFTAFQLNTLLDGQLQSFLSRASPDILIFQRITDLFNSVDVDARDSTVIFGRTALEIRDIARKHGLAVFITLARGRKAQLSALLDASDTAIFVEEKSGMLRLDLLKDLASCIREG